MGKAQVQCPAHENKTTTKITTRKDVKLNMVADSYHLQRQEDGCTFKDSLVYIVSCRLA